MGFFYTDDPVADAEHYAAEQDRQLEKLPVCDYCGEPIQDEFFFLIDDEPICKSCLIHNFRKRVEDYVG